MPRSAEDLFAAAGNARKAGDMQAYNALLNAIPPEARQELINRSMTKFSAEQQVSEMGGMEKFVTAAGIQANKFFGGAADLIGIGDSKRRAFEQDQYQVMNEALMQDSPVTTFTGNAAGGILAAAPLTALTPKIAGAGMAAKLGRYGIGALAGALESGVEYPTGDETRLGNASFGAGAGVFSEALSTAFEVFKRSKTAGILDDQAKAGTINEALSQQGIDIENLRPETQQFLEDLRGDVDVGQAIEQAVQLEFGFKLTAGEAAQDFTQLSTEETAARMSGEAGDSLRGFKVEQNRGILSAAEEIASEAGGDMNTSEGAGNSIKNAMLSVQSGEKDAYTALYDEVRRMASEGGVDIPLATGGVEQQFKNLVTDHGSEYEPLLKDIGRRLSDYGVLDKEMFGSSALLDAAGVDRGALSISNKEDLVKYLNSLYNEDPVRQRIIGKMKEAIEQSSDEVLSQLETIPDETLQMIGLDPTQARKFLTAAKGARSAFSSYKGLWEAKDVIQEITGTKTGTDTPLTDPSAVVSKIMRSPENVGRVVEVLSANGQMQAVSDLRTYILKDIFDQAVNPNNINAAGEAVFSGAKLSSLVKKNADVLERVLSPDQMSQLKAFEEQVGKATKRPVGSVNYSGTAYKLLDFFFNQVGLGKVPLLSMIPEASARSTINSATRDVAAEMLRLGDDHKNLNMVLRQMMNAGDQNFMQDEDEEDRPRGILEQ